jgi:hypothetical protein
MSERFVARIALRTRLTGNGKRKTEPEPLKAWQEIARFLKDGGAAVTKVCGCWPNAPAVQS